MRHLETYLIFNGNCEEALDFYRDIFGGSYDILMRFDQFPNPVPKGYEDKILHSRFNADGIAFMASDAMPEDGPKPNGSRVFQCIAVTEVEELNRLFNGLSNSGTVVLPIEDTFWGAKFAIVVDKYGVHWMLHQSEIPQK